MAINFKDARQKLADATRISTQLNDIISTEERFIRNTKDSANKAKQSQVLEQLAKLDVEKLRDATEQTIWGEFATSRGGGGDAEKLTELSSRHRLKS